MNLPLYNATILENTDGVVVMSLVDEPATEINWVCFNKDSEYQKYAVSDTEEHCLLGVVMVADTPIYRIGNSGFEYYIQYEKETLKIMAEKMLRDNTFNNISIMHNGDVIPKGVVVLRELFIKDEAKGINPTGLENVPDGSLLAVYKVNDEDIWNMCKDGTFNGFSLEGYFGTELVENKKQTKYNKMANKFKNLLKKLLVEAGAISTNNGVLDYEGDEAAVGLEVTNEEGETPEDGEYTAEDGTVYVIKDGKIEEIREPEEEETEEETTETTEEETAEEMEEETEETTEEETTETTEEETTEEEVNEIETLKAELEALKAELESLKEQVLEISTKPVADPITETFSRVNRLEVKDAKLKKMCEAASFLKK